MQNIFSIYFSGGREGRLSAVENISCKLVVVKNLIEGQQTYCTSINLLLYRGGIYWVASFYTGRRTLCIIVWVPISIGDIQQLKCNELDGGRNVHPPLYTFRGSRSCKEYIMWTNGLIQMSLLVRMSATSPLPLLFGGAKVAKNIMWTSNGPINVPLSTLHEMMQRPPLPSLFLCFLGEQKLQRKLCGQWSDLDVPLVRLHAVCLVGRTNRNRERPLIHDEGRGRIHHGG